MNLFRRFMIALSASLVMVVMTLATPAYADDAYFEEVANSLFSDPVFVDPNAASSTTISANQADELRTLITEGNVTVYLAFLDPEETQGIESGELPTMVYEAMKERTPLMDAPGVFMVVNGDDFYAEAWRVTQPVAESTPALASELMSAENPEPFAVYKGFITEINAVNDTGETTSATEPSDTGSILAVALVILAVACSLVLIVVFLVQRAKHRNQHVRSANSGPTYQSRGDYGAPAVSRRRSDPNYYSPDSDAAIAATLAATQSNPSKSSYGSSRSGGSRSHGSSHSDSSGGGFFGGGGFSSGFSGGGSFGGGGFDSGSSGGGSFGD